MEHAYVEEEGERGAMDPQSPADQGHRLKQLLGFNYDMLQQIKNQHLKPFFLLFVYCVFFILMCV